MNNSKFPTITNFFTLTQQLEQIYNKMKKVFCLLTFIYFSNCTSN